jgi:Ca-activated chloride channel homolog
MSVLSPAWLALILVVPPLVILTVRAFRRQEPALSPARRRGFLALRSAAIVLLALALAGLGVARLSDRLSMVFLLDQSYSVNDAQRSAALDFIEKIRGRLSRGDSASLVRFGANADLELLAPGVPPQQQAGDDVDASATDIAGAIQFGLAQVGEGGAESAGYRGAGSADSADYRGARIVLLSDGNENRGSAEQAATVARSLGAKIFPVPLSALLQADASQRSSEVSVEDIRAPERVRQGEAHEVTVMVKSRTETRARVSLFRDGQPVATRDGILAAGQNAVQFSGVFPEQGLHAWDALVEAPRDAVPENNHYRRFVQVTGTPQVLVVTGKGRQSQPLLAALSAQGISTVSADVAALPGTLAGFLPYDAIILDNAPGYGISNEKMETIARYVRDAGGGLLMVGGENSFGAGGYFKTPIERVLPVDMDVKSQVQLPHLSLVIVVDKSGSMGSAVPTGETKLDVVKSAALSAIEILNPFDRVGILAFDADWQWTVPLTNAGETQKIAQDLSTLSAGGGTIMYPALEEAYRVISASPSPLRHVIVLTDGLTNPGAFEELVRKMARAKITVSTVAVGEDADKTLLKNIATWGGGRTYATDDPRDVPQIFVTETTLVTRSLLVEKSFFPSVVDPGETLRGISLQSMPALGGFVLTYLKPGAQAELSALYDAPLLATWRYGLGRTAAFTSDFRAHWATAWLSWGQFPRVAAQLVRWIERPSGGDVLHPRIDIDKGRASISVDAYDDVGAFANGLTISGIVLGPQGDRSEISLPQTGPGLYAGIFEAGRVGDYTVTLSARRGTESLAPVTLGASVPYSDEFRMLGVDSPLMARVASASGGRIISSADDEAGLSELLRREPGRSATSNGAWRYLLLVALLLFFLDIVVRRLAVPEGLRARIAARRQAWKSARRKPGLSYEEISGMVTKAHEEERSKLKKKIAGMAQGGRLDSELAAYLYIARLRSRKAQESEEGGKKGE